MRSRQCGGSSLTRIGRWACNPRDEAANRKHESVYGVHAPSTDGAPVHTSDISKEAVHR